MPNSVNPEIESAELINRRVEKHDNRIKGKNKTNKILYQVGERVRLQNVANKEWVLKGTIDLLRTTDDGRVVSYDIITDKGYMTTQHRRYLRPLHPEHDPKLQKVDNKKTDVIKNDDDTCEETKETADLLTADQNVAESRELTSYIVEIQQEQGSN